jgi:hypothetical protein
MNKPYPALCRDCKHCIPEPGSEWTLRCMHPVVNAGDPWALAGAKPHGSGCRDERARVGFFAPCGKPGKLWEAATIGATA